VAPYRNNREFIRQFGDLMVMQIPEEMSDPPPANDGHFGFLMQFADGNRIDLGFHPIEHIDLDNVDSLTVVLVDKDNLLAGVPPPSEKDYLPEQPTAKLFSDCCNEFWWVCPYVAKGLWREELIYAKYMMDSVVRPELLKMMSWYFGKKTDFKLPSGKGGKNIKSHVDPSLWSKLEQTYPDADFRNIWASLFAMGDLFRIIANHVAQAFGFEYPESDDSNVSRYLERIRKLPKDATEIY
jgi:aminoglycoside 6-adenylyltransferase